MIKYIGKTLVIEENKTLVIGDLHLGYEESLNLGGVMIYRKMFEEMTNYLDRIFERIGNMKKVVLLGDVKHDFGRVLRQERDDFSQFIDYLKEHSKEIIIVKGNHDINLGLMARGKDIEIMDFYIEGDYCFMHGDRDFAQIWDKKVKYWIMGHIHPAVRLSEGVKTEKYKCFLVGEFAKKEIIVVPSFIDYYEGSDPREQEIKLAWDMNLLKFKVKIIDENLDVLDFGRLKDIK